MSLFNRKKGISFFDHISKTTNDALVHAATNRKNNLNILNSALQSYFESCIIAIKEKLKYQIQTSANAAQNSAMYRLCPVVSDPISIEISSTDGYIDMSNIPLSTFISSDIKRKYTIEFNGFTFSGCDLIDFPSVSTIVEKLRAIEDFNKFTFKIGTTYEGVKPIATIIIEW
jgi:hypothetical protein